MGLVEVVVGAGPAASPVTANEPLPVRAGVSEPP
eukprot:CAMPEP_0202875106 /NCGR_PEP_ID=MMETSP1391-20130828/26631_1 /ASSEMBLY_ACC=CAM_ASM_000867 /TAXON_ID=1034604 /ORGANISM="Chlamydomonas leiostraca, Strain SAG 11-49" /LENGTH=33 /DNA_ID= /DNA_START= /DNA_END= /DNA_ORIENTATION=